MERNTVGTGTIRVFAFALVAALVLAPTPAQASLWFGGNGNWSSDGDPGWDGSGVPNAAGAIADFGNTAGTTTQDIVAGVTVGTIRLTGASGGVRSITMTNGITFNNNASGALIDNNNLGANSQLKLTSGAGVLTLADNLTISNTGGSTKSDGSVWINAKTITGTGNLTLYNVSNDVAAGQIRVDKSAATDFAGSVLIQKGAVTFNANSFPSSATITLGSAGYGSATFIGTASNSNIPNNIVVAAGTGGTLVLGSLSVTANVTFTYLGTLTLNGDVSLRGNHTGTGRVRYTDAISGAGNVTTIGTGITQFGDGSTSITNTYTGNTTLGETSLLTLADNAALTFVIGASGVNNRISGTNNNVLTLDGDFIFDLSGAAAVGSWTIVDVATVNETFGTSFTVAGFTESSDVWTKTSGPITYTFTEATGVLTAIPEPATLALLVLGGLLAVARRRSA